MGRVGVCWQDVTNLKVFLRSLVIATPYMEEWEQLHLFILNHGRQTPKLGVHYTILYTFTYNSSHSNSQSIQENRAVLNTVHKV